MKEPLLVLSKQPQEFLPLFARRKGPEPQLVGRRRNPM